MNVPLYIHNRLRRWVEWRMYLSEWRGGKGEGRGGCEKLEICKDRIDVHLILLIYIAITSFNFFSYLEGSTNDDARLHACIDC